MVPPQEGVTSTPTPIIHNQELQAQDPLLELQPLQPSHNELSQAEGSMEVEALPMSRPPSPIEVPTATSWQDDRPWHLPSSSSNTTPTGYSRSGRALRPTIVKAKYINAVDVTTPVPVDDASSSTTALDVMQL